MHLCIVEAHERIQTLKNLTNPNRREPKKVEPLNPESRKNQTESKSENLQNPKERPEKPSLMYTERIIGRLPRGGCSSFMPDSTLQVQGCFFSKENPCRNRGRYQN